MTYHHYFIRWCTYDEVQTPSAWTGCSLPYESSDALYRFTLACQTEPGVAIIHFWVNLLTPKVKTEMEGMKTLGKQWRQRGGGEWKQSLCLQFHVEMLRLHIGSQFFLGMKIDFYVLKEGFRTLRENKKVKKVMWRKLQNGEREKERVTRFYLSMFRSHV